jgi:hypothetical protein
MRAQKILPVAAFASISMAMLTACGSGISSDSSHLSQELTTKDNAPANSTGISGEIHCQTGSAVVGVWVKAENGKDSRWADWKPVNENTTATATWWAGLPAGEKYSLHVGCGGSPTQWAAETETGIMSVQKSNITCDDLPDRAQTCTSTPIGGAVPPVPTPTPTNTVATAPDDPNAPPAGPGTAPDPTDSAFAYTGTDYSGEIKSLPLTMFAGGQYTGAVHSVVNNTGHTLCGRNFEDTDPSAPNYTFWSGGRWNMIGTPFDDAHPLDFFSWC